MRRIRDSRGRAVSAAQIAFDQEKKDQYLKREAFREQNRVDTELRKEIQSIIRDAVLEDASKEEIMAELCENEKFLIYEQNFSIWIDTQMNKKDKLKIEAEKKQERLLKEDIER